MKRRPPQVPLFWYKLKLGAFYIFLALIRVVFKDAGFYSFTNGKWSKPYRTRYRAVFHIEGSGDLYNAPFLLYRPQNADVSVLGFWFGALGDFRNESLLRSKIFSYNDSHRIKGLPV